MVCDSHALIHIPSDMLSKHIAGSHVIVHTHRHTNTYALNNSDVHIIHTHQDFTAVTKPAAAVLSGQDKGECLTVNNIYTQQMIFKCFDSLPKNM